MTPTQSHLIQLLSEWGKTSRNAEKSSGKYQHNQVCHTSALSKRNVWIPSKRLPNCDTSNNQELSESQPPHPKANIYLTDAGTLCKLSSWSHGKSFSKWWFSLFLKSKKAKQLWVGSKRDKQAKLSGKTSLKSCFLFNWRHFLWGSPAPSTELKESRVRRSAVTNGRLPFFVWDCKWKGIQGGNKTV